MLSEYHVRCPDCGTPRALHYRDLSSFNAHVECPKCGFHKEHRLPQRDEWLAGALLNKAKRRVMVRSLIQSSRRLIIPIAYIFLIGIYYHDEKLTTIMGGMFLMLLSLSPGPSIQKQLTYVLRLMQHHQMMDEDLDAILRDEPKAYMLLHDYSLLSPYGEEDARTLDSHYDACVAWLAASLRSIGCNEDAVKGETERFRKVVTDIVKETRARLAESDLK
jgi:hypothetical protein